MEQRIAERTEALRQNEQRLRVFIQQAPAPVAMFDMRMCYLAASDRWASEFGLTDRNFIGQCHYDLFPDFPEAWKLAHARALAGEIVRCEGEQWVRADGTRPWIRWETRPWLTTSGAVGGISISAEDISARKRAEEALLQSEKLSRRTLQALTAHVAVLDHQGRILATNHAWEEFAKANHAAGSPSVRVGASYLETCRRAVAAHDESAARALAGIESVMSGRQAQFSMEYGCHSPREERWFLMTVVPLDGVADGAVVTHLNITERKRAENALRESEARVQASLEASPAGILVMDGHGTITMLNSELARLSGYSGGELIGQSVQILVPEHLRERHAGFHEVYLREPMARRMGTAAKLSLRRRDATLVPVEIALSPRAVFENGIQVMAIVTDISARVTAEEALRESEERLRVSEQRYRDLADQVTDGIFLADPEGNYLDANRAFCGMFGYCLDEIRTRGFSDMVAPDQRWQFPNECCGADGKETVRTEWRFQRKDGSIFTGELDARQLPDGRCLGAVRDVTERKEQDERLRDSEERLRLAVESANVGLWDWNLLTNKVQRTSQWKRQLGFRDDEIGDDFDDWTVRVHPQDLEVALRAARESRVDPQGQYLAEYRMRHKDGSYRNIYSIGKLHCDANGKPIRMLGCDIDITERKRAEEALREQDQQKDEFLALLGHELRNPLAAISTAMHLLLACVTPERRDELINLIGRQTGTLQRLVDELLDLSRITQGKIELTYERVDLSDLLQAVSSVARTAFATRSQELVLRLPAGYVHFMADRVRLEQVVMNLLSNASKYTQRGGTVEISAAREGGEVVIRCRDNGQGIPPGNLQKIFEPFARGRNTDLGYGEPSLGIGLTLVKRLVELHGGRITAESAGPGIGSEFTVRLPLIEPSVAPVQSGSRDPFGARRPLSLVLVEDNPDVALTMACALEQAGHQVTVFGSGTAALTGLTQAHPDAILIDIGLPGMDGPELAIRLRQQQNLQQTLFVALSGHARRASVAEAGFDEYFVKPVAVNVLLAYLDMRIDAMSPRMLRVLLVEDNLELAEVTADMLRHEGLEVAVAHSGGEAIEAASAFVPHLLLCDWYLPDMPGKDVVHGLRANAATRRTYAVILTGRRREDIAAFQQQAAQLGIDEVIPKPLLPDGLHAVLAKLRDRGLIATP